MCTEGVRDDLVVGDGDALLADAGKAALVDEFAYGLKVGGSVGNVRARKPKHVDGRRVNLHEHRAIDLPIPPTPHPHSERTADA